MDEHYFINIFVFCIRCEGRLKKKIGFFFFLFNN